MTTLQTEYEGYIIRWDDFSMRFDILDKETGNKATQKCVRSIAGAKTWIDNRNKTSYKRVPVIAPDSPYGGGKKRPGEATSPVDDDQAWLSFANPKSRYKQYMHRVWLDTPSNRAIMEEVKTKELQVKTLEAEIKALEESAVKLTIEDFEVPQ